MKKLNTIFLGLLILFVSCDDMLEELPSKQQNIIPQTVEHLMGFYSDEHFRNVQITPQVYMSDDYAPNKEYQKVDPGYYIGSKNNNYAMFWNFEAIIANDYSGSFWSNEYDKIYKANTIIDYISSIRGTNAQKNYLKGSAYFTKALSHFRLVEYFSNPVQKDFANANDMGVPIQNKIDLMSYPSRSSLKETYDFIINTLKTAEELLKGFKLAVAENGKPAQWRPSITAVYALYAKVYFTIGNYGEALKYAKLALENKGVARLVDFKTEMAYNDEAKKVKIINADGSEEEEEVLMPNTTSNTFYSYDWDEHIYREKTDFSAELFPSDELVALYGTQANRVYDLRWKYFYVKNYSILDPNFQGKKDAAGNVEFAVNRINVYKGLNSVSLSIPELYLIKAECIARTASFSDAQKVVNELRANRFAADAPDNIKNLSFTDQGDAIQKIINERRRELPFYNRWFDIKRLAGQGEFNYIPTTISKDFYEYNDLTVDTSKEKTYTFNPQTDIKKFAYPISITEILKYRQFGTDLKQNQY